ncbi:MAG: putative Fe-S protein YdhL (DUF1289 family) [Planctomycetota bacterium]|jgi:predicted Fe-S protein YdhL (DUF1289 family)
MSIVDEPCSPCINICTLDPEKQLCLGCLRTVEEITNWASFCAQEKHDVINKYNERILLLSNS